MEPIATTAMQDIEGHLIAYQESLWAEWDESPSDHLYHYTSLNGLRGILESRAFWATDIRYMNDMSEAGYASNVVLDALKNRRDILSTGLTDNFKRTRRDSGFRRRVAPLCGLFLRDEGFARSVAGLHDHGRGCCSICSVRFTPQVR